MSEENLSQQFQVHYYFDDESHSMNAFVRNRAEKDLLEAVKRILELSDVTAEIETEAFNEGGLIETLNLIIPSLSAVAIFLSPAINEILKHHFTKNKTDDVIKEETLKGLQLDNSLKELDYETKFAKALEDKLVKKHVSNYYSRIIGYEKVEKIGFKNLSIKTDEIVIPRSRFKDFILVDDKTVTEDDDAEIEIISPVLKEGTFNWRGSYKEQRIDFSMGDARFKNEVINGQHQFANGFVMSCLLQVTTTFDEFGDEKRRSYSVRKVYAIKESGSTNYTLRPLGFKKKEGKDQRPLFDDGE
ncbi:hypothetical protein LG198_13770 [Methylobacillus arboreus]|uniref:hypothetical protein n=1 Tax=Methylobacillus arboreus TaxID=755170 RepID=UPI001E5A18BF|nr:hypothetical protein [Methylobacillus arboreus]MCB5191802.1 hypothetical protein [Methylobacillus arboreus]